jgi:hypothetical protein
MSRSRSFVERCVTFDASLMLSAVGTINPRSARLIDRCFPSKPVVDMAAFFRFTGAQRACAGERFGSNREA